MNCKITVYIYLVFKAMQKITKPLTRRDLLSIFAGENFMQNLNKKRKYYETKKSFS